MKKELTRVKKFIKDNDLDFTDSGSGLNGNCLVLAGFICHVMADREDWKSSREVGRDIIDTLKLSDEADTELQRVFEFAWENSYEDYWETDEAELEYTF